MVSERRDEATSTSVHRRAHPCGVDVHYGVDGAQGHPLGGSGACGRALWGSLLIDLYGFDKL